MKGFTTFPWLFLPDSYVFCLVLGQKIRILYQNEAYRPQSVAVSGRTKAGFIKSCESGRSQLFGPGRDR
jgi:hypothetical protein